MNRKECLWCIICFQANVWLKKKNETKQTTMNIFLKKNGTSSKRAAGRSFWDVPEEVIVITGGDLSTHVNVPGGPTVGLDIEEDSVVIVWPELSPRSLCSKLSFQRGLSRDGGALRRWGPAGSLGHLGWAIERGLWTPTPSFHFWLLARRWTVYSVTSSLPLLFSRSIGVLSNGSAGPRQEPPTL